MKNIVFILLSFVLAGELEVDGNLKVTGNIDASGQPNNTVGVPLSMTDAMNGNVLQDVLRDEGPSEYKLVATKLTSQMLQNNGSFTLSYKNYGETSWNSNFETYLNTLEDSGWYILKVIPYVFDPSYNMSYNYYIFRRSLEE